MATLQSLEDIKHAFYINLETRPDRRVHVEKQMQLLGIPAQRFNAIKLKNGALGCSMSHLKCLETAKQNGWDHILIVEDDILFIDPSLFKNQMNLFLKNHSDTFDVVLVAGNNVPPYQQVDDSCIKIRNCQTTTGYLVKSHYYDILIQNVKEGIQHLMKTLDHHVMYAIDKYWFRLQERDNWFLIIPLSVIQREDYSDIEKRAANYKKVMLDLDKPWLSKNREKLITQSIQNLKMQEELKIIKPSRKMGMFI